MRDQTIRIRSWRPIAKPGSTLLGFAEVQLPSGMIIADITVHSRDGKTWASPPSKMMVDRDGAIIRDGSGKAKYSPIITFTDTRTRSRWSEAVVAAVQCEHPEALPGGAS